MYRKVVLLVIVVLAVAILLTGVAIDREQAELARRSARAYVDETDETRQRAPGTSDALGFPASGGDTFSLIHHDPETNVQQYQISGDRAFPHADGSFEIVAPVITFFTGEDGQDVLLRISSERGAFYGRQDKRVHIGRYETVAARGRLWGSVKMASPDGITAEFDAAEWDEQSRMITTEPDKPVTITTPHFVVHGKGMEIVAGMDADEIIIKKDVSVVFDESADEALTQAFAIEESSAQGPSAGMVLTCDGTLAYRISQKDVTFEDNVLLAPVAGAYSPGRVAAERAMWLARMAEWEKRLDAGEPLPDVFHKATGPLLAARKSLTLRMTSEEEEDDAEKRDSWQIDTMTAQGDVWFLRGQEKAYTQQLEFTGEAAVFTGGVGEKPAHLWHDRMELEGEGFRVSGLSGQGTPTIWADRPGILHTDAAMTGAQNDAGDSQGAQIAWQRSFRWSDKERSAIFEGDIVAQDASGKLTADRLTMDMAPDPNDAGKMALSRTRAQGHVQYVEADKEINAAEMTFDSTDDSLLLVGRGAELASVKMGSDTIMSETLTILDTDQGYHLKGKGAGRLLYYDEVAPSDEPSYDVRWKERCAYSDAQAVFTGEVSARRGEGTLRCQTLTMTFDAAKKGAAMNQPREIIADGAVLFDDLSRMGEGGRTEPLHAQGDRMTYDYRSGVMKLENTHPYDHTLRNLPPEAAVSVDVGDNRITSRVIHYQEIKAADGTASHVLWTQRGGEIDTRQRSESESESAPPVRERTRIRCDKTIVYGPANRVIALLPKIGLALGKSPLPARLLPIDPAERNATSIALFVGDKHNVRVRREVAEAAGGELVPELKLNCAFLEVHFAPVTDPDGRTQIDAARMRALKDVFIERRGRALDTATGQSALWQRIPRRLWRAEITGKPYATLTSDQQETTCKKIIFFGVPAEVKMEDIVSVDAEAR